MKKSYRNCYFLVILLFLNYNILFSQNFSQVIQEIKVEGNQKVDTNTILSYLSFKKGQVLDKEKVKKSFKKLYKSNIVKEIIFETEKHSKGGITFIVKVKEFPIIANIFLIGNENVSKTKLLKDINIKVNEPFIENKVNRAKYIIKANYLKENYFDTEIEVFGIKGKNPNTIDVTFDIKEGSLIIVKDILFNNVKVIKGDEISSIIKTRKKSFLNSGKFNINDFIIDKKRVVFYYQTKGYLNAKIKKTNFYYEWKDPSKKQVKLLTISFDIEEGELFYFGNLVIKGNKIFKTNELEVNINRQPGEVFNEKIHLEDLQSIKKKYQKYGYIFSRITAIKTVRKGNVVDYVFDIYEGEKSYIQNISISGLTKTKEYVIKRELLIREGQLFSLSSIESSIFLLKRLDYFSEVTPSYTKGSVERLMNLGINVKEKSTGLFTSGITYGTASGFNINFEFKERNFLGKGQNVTTKISYGLKTKQIVLSFEEPWFIGKQLSLGFSVGFSKNYLSYRIDKVHLREDGTTKNRLEFPGNDGFGPLFSNNRYIYYTQKNLSFSIFSSKNFFSWYYIIGTLTIAGTNEYLQDFKAWPEKYIQKEIYLKNKELFKVAPPIDETILNYILSLELKKDTRNSFLNPSSGQLFSLKTSIILGDYNLTKWTFSMALYNTQRWYLWNTNWKWITVYQTQLSTLGRSLNNTFKYPSRNFYYFNDYDLRGWSYYNIYSFRRIRHGEEGLIDGSRALGQAKFKQTLEFRFSIATDIIQLVPLFIDAGNLSNEKINTNIKSVNFVTDWKDYLYDIGFGARLNLPQFPIRLYWSWRLIYDQQKNKLMPFVHSNKLWGSPNTYSPSLTLVFKGTF